MRSTFKIAAATLTATLALGIPPGIEWMRIQTPASTQSPDDLQVSTPQQATTQNTGAQTPVAPQQPQAAQPTAAKFSAEQLEQMVAPIALHPDSLLTQIFMAATYPLEVVEAERWLKRYPQLAGTDLEEALKQEEWDPSVKALCGVPTVLQQMSDNLDWTQDLGDAFLAQKDELLDAVQRMRRKALDAGNLKSTTQQTVTPDDRVIVIESANPDVVYVPTYSPVVVYGAGWYYPYWYYPSFYVVPPPGYGFLAFSVGFFWGWGTWSHCDWHHHQVNIDADHFNRFNQHTSAHPGSRQLGSAPNEMVPWTHAPEHRRGVNYRTPQIASQFGAAPGASRLGREQTRGFNRTPFDRGTPGAAGMPRTPGSRSTRPPPMPSPERSRPGGGPPPSATPIGPQRSPPSFPASPPTRVTRGAPPGSERAPSLLSETQISPSLLSRGNSAIDSAVRGYRTPGFDRSASARGAMSRGLARGGSFRRG